MPLTTDSELPGSDLFDDVEPPLAGCRVIEFGQYIAVPGAAQILADQGATVIKVEPIGGEACRRLAGLGPAMFNAYNRGKRMVELDLTTSAAVDHARRLIGGADVVLSNMKPGSLARYGLSEESIRALNPQAIVLTLSGFGDTPDMARRPGLDIAAQAESGIMWVTGEESGEPQRVGFAVVDAAAAITAAQAVTAALLRRTRTGSGAAIKLSLWDVAIHLQAPNWMGWFLGGAAPLRKGNGQPGVAPAADLVRVSDGYVVVSAYLPHQWSALCSAIGRADLTDHPDLATATARARNRELMHVELSRALADLPRAAAVQLLSAAGVVAGAVQDYPDTMAARSGLPGSIFLSGRHDGRSMNYVGTPLEWAGSAPHAGQPRALGADNDLLHLTSEQAWRQASESLSQEGTR